MSAQYPGIGSGMNPQAQVAMPGEVPREPGLVLLWWTQCRGWVQAHRLDLAVVAGLLLAVGLVHGIGYDRFPGRINDDEGTYATQAYAVQYWHTMAHYTYWYDHPPLGWITIAAYTWATHAFERLPTAVTAGRETMLWAAVISAALMYLLARRLGFHRTAAAAAVLIFGLSPLAVSFQRMIFLDNLAVMWTLAALALAASPRRSLAAATGSAACFAMAVLSKETTLVLLPALLVLLWQHTSTKTRPFSIPMFLTLLAGLVSLYPLYAIVKNELLQGPGHVSLIWGGMVKSCGSPVPHDHAATSSISSSGAFLGRSTSLPFLKLAPARTSATRCGPLTARQRPSAASSSLNTIANPASLLPGPLVTRVLARTGEKVDSIGFVVRRCSQCSAG